MGNPENFAIAGSATGALMRRTPGNNSLVGSGTGFWAFYKGITLSVSGCVQAQSQNPTSEWPQTQIVVCADGQTIAPAKMQLVGSEIYFAGCAITSTGSPNFKKMILNSSGNVTAGQMQFAYTGSGTSATYASLCVSTQNRPFIIAPVRYNTVTSKGTDYIFHQYVVWRGNNDYDLSGAQLTKLNLPADPGSHTSVQGIVPDITPMLGGSVLAIYPTLVPYGGSLNFLVIGSNLITGAQFNVAPPLPSGPTFPAEHRFISSISHSSQNHCHVSYIGSMEGSTSIMLANFSYNPDTMDSFNQEILKRPGAGLGGQTIVLDENTNNLWALAYDGTGSMLYACSGGSPWKTANWGVVGSTAWWIGFGSIYAAQGAVGPSAMPLPSGTLRFIITSGIAGNMCAYGELNIQEGGAPPAFNFWSIAHS